MSSHSNLTTATWPSCEAFCSVAQPSVSHAASSAPFLSRNPTTASWSCIDAHRSAVMPYVSHASTSAPLSSGYWRESENQLSRHLRRWCAIIFAAKCNRRQRHFPVPTCVCFYQKEASYLWGRCGHRVCTKRRGRIELQPYAPL